MLDATAMELVLPLTLVREVVLMLLVVVLVAGAVVVLEVELGLSLDKSTGQSSSVTYPIVTTLQSGSGGDGNPA